MKKQFRYIAFICILSFSITAFAFVQFAPAVFGGAMWLGRAASSAFTFKRATDLILPTMAIGGSYVLANSDFTKVFLGNSDTATSGKAALIIDPSSTRSRENPDPVSWSASGRDFTPKSSYALKDTAAYPPQNVPICNIVLNSIEQPYDTFTFSSPNVWKKTYFSTKTYVNPGAGYSSESLYTCGGANYYLWSKATVDVASSVNCPAGYTRDGTFNCILANATQVTKPANMPCEVLFNGTGFELDAKNTNCSALSSALTLNNGAIRNTRAVNDWDEIKVDSTGKGYLRGATTAWDWSMVFNPSSVAGDYAPASLSLYPSGTLSGDTPGTGTGTGTGSSSSTGTSSGTSTGSNTNTGSGTSAWLCGLAGLPPCNVAIDSAGIPTSVDALANPSQLVSEAYKPLDTKVTNPDGLWPAFPVINWNFALPTSCSVIAVPAFAPFLTSIDICQFQPTFHSIMSVVWVLGGLFGSIGLFWRNVMATN